MQQSVDDSMDGGAQPSQNPSVPSIPAPPPPPPSLPLVHPFILLATTTSADSLPASPTGGLTSNPHLLLTKPRALALASSSASSRLMPPEPESQSQLHPAADCRIGRGGSIDDCAVFPPRFHEGLHLQTKMDLVPPLTPPPPSLEEEDEERVVLVEALGAESEEDAARRYSSSLPVLLKSGMARLWDSVTKQSASLCQGDDGVLPEVIGRDSRIGVWSAMAAVATVGALLYMRRRDRRERDLLLLLVQEKEQRIQQLLHQITRMSDKC